MCMFMCTVYIYICITLILLVNQIFLYILFLHACGWFFSLKCLVYTVPWAAASVAWLPWAAAWQRGYPGWPHRQRGYPESRDCRVRTQTSPKLVMYLNKTQMYYFFVHFQKVRLLYIMPRQCGQFSCASAVKVGISLMSSVPLILLIVGRR